MRTFAPRLAVGAALLAAATLGCSVPGQVGLGALQVSALAISTKDPETGNPSYKVLLDWPPALNARNYEVLRKFGTNPAKVAATVQTDEWTDIGVGADQSFTYTIRALSGENKELTVSNPVTLTVLGSTVAKPTLSEPAANATLGVGEVPTFKWQAVEGANGYYLRVVNVAKQNELVYSALTKDTSIKFGADSPIKLDAFASQFPVGKKSDITAGFVYRWEVQAVRANNADLGKANAIDLNPSEARPFSQG